MRITLLLACRYNGMFCALIIVTRPVHHEYLVLKSSSIAERLKYGSANICVQKALRQNVNCGLRQQHEKRQLERVKAS
jgi:hypothetical protein